MHKSTYVAVIHTAMKDLMIDVDKDTDVHINIVGNLIVVLNHGNKKQTLAWVTPIDKRTVQTVPFTTSIIKTGKSINELGTYQIRTMLKAGMSIPYIKNTLGVSYKDVRVLVDTI